MMLGTLDQGDWVRIGYVVFSLYSLLVLVSRWRVAKVLTQDRRFLFLFILLEVVSTTTSGLLKIAADAPSDVSVWLTLLTQSFLAAYLHHSVPRSQRSRLERLLAPPRR